MSTYTKHNKDKFYVTTKAGYRVNQNGVPLSRTGKRMFTDINAYPDYHNVKVGRYRPTPHNLTII